MAKSSAWLGCAALLTLSAFGERAHAFEREWHAGGGVGFATGSGVGSGPELGAYGAYGVSDAFDVRLELDALGYSLGSAQDPNALSVRAGVAYKLDIIQWVPWFAGYLGYQHLFGTPGPETERHRDEPLIVGGLGLDYAFSRDFGLGVTLRLDQSLTASEARSFGAQLRAEYRWGF